MKINIKRQKVESIAKAGNILLYNTEREDETFIVTTGQKDEIFIVTENMNIFSLTNCTFYNFAGIKSIEAKKRYIEGHFKLFEDKIEISN